MATTLDPIAGHGNPENSIITKRKYLSIAVLLSVFTLTAKTALGLFATLQGINHAGKHYENGGDGVEAMFEGLGVAIAGTACGLVGAAELEYKALSSLPSRFLGRGIRAGFIKLDEKSPGQRPEEFK